MSLIRQLALLLATTVVLAFAGSVAVNVDSTRRLLETQLQLKNSDNAGALALALSQQKGEPERMALLLAAQFDTGYYRHLRYVADDGRVAFEREALAVAPAVPEWFIRLTPITVAPGMAQVSDGWRPLGSVQVESHTAYVHDELWRGSWRAVLALAGVGLLSGFLGGVLLSRLRRPLERTVEQARAIERGEYLIVSEPKVPELRGVTRAMNSMVARLKLVFEAQSTQVEAMRAQANHDPLTGLSNRANFMGRLAGVLEAEDGAPACGLVLLRVLNLADINHKLGRTATDRLLEAIGQTLETYAQRVPGCLIGRLNGSDFALCLPVAGVSVETAHAAVELLRAVLPAFGGNVVVAAGVGEARRGTPLRALMSATDLALARAETNGAFAVEIDGGVMPTLAVQGQAAWGNHVRDALREGRARLGSFPVIDALQRTLHLECPLRLQLERDGGYEVAAVWLPLALRNRLTALADEHALALALAAIKRDGQPRCINLSPASLADAGFVSRLRGRLLHEPRAAASLFLDVAEAAAVDHFEWVRELGRQLRPTGARLGLEHAGERLGRIERLIELGLDYVKLDASVSGGVAADVDRSAFVSGMVAMLHGLSVQVYAEGVALADDARALWECGLDGLTGPWVSAQMADAATAG